MTKATILANEVKPHGFKRRGSTMFRVHGDGVLQILKYERDRAGLELCVGLLSMYSELMPQWLTSRGSVGQYFISDAIGTKSGILMPEDIGDTSVGLDIQVLRKYGIPFLNAMVTQKDLIEGMLFLERRSIRWVDDRKIAPYLVCRDWGSAEKVVTTILEQHRHAYRANRSLFFTKEAYEEYLKPRLKDDEVFESILAMIQARDEEKVQAYLKRNYETNSELASFCMK